LEGILRSIAPPSSTIIIIIVRVPLRIAVAVVASFAVFFLPDVAAEIRVVFTRRRRRLLPLLVFRSFLPHESPNAGPLGDGNATYALVFSYLGERERERENKKKE